MKEMVNRNLEIGFTKFHLFQKQPFRVSSTNIMMGNGLVVTWVSFHSSIEVQSTKYTECINLDSILTSNTELSEIKSFIKTLFLRLFFFTKTRMCKDKHFVLLPHELLTQL